MFALIALTAVVCTAAAALPPTCDSQVYCQGPLLHTVQMSRLFNDSKTFVDLKMKQPEDITLKNFQAMLQANSQEPSLSAIEAFVNENFEDGNELEEWTPPDFKSEPKFLNNIRDMELRSFAKKVVGNWKTLARKVKRNVTMNAQLYSLIPLPNGFVIPGGRFKEIYYWDSYWIINGLLISEMADTAKGMIENLMYLVKKFGFVPNGSRLYYTRRSQPPLLTKMVSQYVEHTNDLMWLAKNIHILEQELRFWIQKHEVKVKVGHSYHTMYQYNAPSAGPRPESYREDINTAKTSPDPEKTYADIKSASESGWDFSSRWIFDENGGNRANLTSINTHRIVPVDLNSYLYEAFSTLASLHSKLKDPKRSLKWRRRATSLGIAITSVLWNNDIGIWLDYDVQLKKHRNYFYPSNLTPLWVKCCVNRNNNDAFKKIMIYLKNEAIQSYLGGTPTSLINSGEQWDLPNALPPLQAIMVQALQNTNYDEAVALAKTLAERWVNANLRGFKEHDVLYEKYNAETPGSRGGGGEYVVQEGFGWTNGVVLEFMNTYGNTLSVKY